MLSAARPSGVVASKTPMPPSAIIRPIHVAKRSAGAQRPKTNSAPTSTPLTPRPIIKRPAKRLAKPSAKPYVTAPATAKVKMTGSVRRTPKRSNNIPSGICATAKDRKKTPVSPPNASAERPNSALNSLAMTPFDVR